MPADRVAYSAIGERPVLRWPNDARVALWVVPNLEHYEYLPGPSPALDPWPRSPHPDVPGYSTRDYGNRVGVWRLFEAFDRLGITATVAFNVGAFEHYPELFTACEARGYDYLCHGIYNTRYHWGMSPPEERAEIADCVESFRRISGRTFDGWFTPFLSPTLHTPDLVAAAGISYYCDWVFDDQPFPLRVQEGRLLAMPYSVDVNDAVVYRQGFEAAEFARVITDHFAVLHRDGLATGRVMCVALHPYISGQPHWIDHVARALEEIVSRDGVWVATGSEIAAWYYATMWDAIQVHLGETDAGS